MVQDFDNILEKALELLQTGKTIPEILTLFPEHESELKELLLVAIELLVDQKIEAPKSVLQKTLAELSASAAAPTKNLSYRYRFILALRRLGKNLNKINPFNMKPQRTILIGASLLVIVLVAYMVSTSTTDQLILQNRDEFLSSSQGVEVEDKATKRRSLDSPASSEEDLGVAYSQATGLGAADEESTLKRLKKIVLPRRGHGAVIDGMIESEEYIEPNIGIAPVPPPGYGGNTPNITDDREFFKTSYRATLKTRQPNELGGRAQTIVRGHGGRIDSSSITYRFASLSFVLPKQNFDSFKLELRSLVGDRFFAEAISSYNLLPQKQNIENNTEITTDRLTTLAERKESMIEVHNKNVANFNAQISGIDKDLNELRQQEKNTHLMVEVNKIREQIAELEQQRKQVAAALFNERSRHTTELQVINNQIENREKQLTNLGEQDQNLLDNVETVNGIIVINWISLGQILNLYLKDYWGLVLVVIVVGGGYGWHRYRQKPEVVGIDGRLPVGLTEKTVTASDQEEKE